MIETVHAWPTGVRAILLRDGYERAPVDVVARQAVEIGPPYRRLLAATWRETIKGVLSLSASEIATFEAWRKTTLGRSSEAFAWTLRDTDQDRIVSVRLSEPPVQTQRAGGRVQLDMSFITVPEAPTAAFLSTLAGLHKAAPAAWPAGVSYTPKRDAWQGTADDVVARGTPQGPAVTRLLTRQEGLTEEVTLGLTPQELRLFETWFVNEAAFGVRDVAFPVSDGATHLGCFASAYTVRPDGQTARWAVSFKRYLEAQP